MIRVRPYKPRDKTKVEVTVLVAERWSLAALLKRTFFSLAEVNVAIRERLEWLNERPFRKLPGSRRSLFEALDRAALRPPPAQPYEFVGAPPRSTSTTTRRSSATGIPCRTSRSGSTQ